MSEFSPATGELIAAVWAERWGGLVVTPERTYTPTDVEGLTFRARPGTLLALVTWAIHESEAEIVTLDAIRRGRGYGRRALAAAEIELAGRGVRRLHLVTTNDNVNAISMYLRLDWRLVRLHLDCMDGVRALKPGVPIIGEGGIPLRDMWEFEKVLDAPPGSHG